jgi:hypothetical protein
MPRRRPSSNGFGSCAEVLWHVACDTLDDILFAAAKLYDVAIRVADEKRHLTAVIEADRTLGYRDVVRLQGADRRRDGSDPEGHVGVARILLRSIHQHIRSRIARIGVEDQVELGAGELPSARELLASITNKVIDRAKLPNRFNELYPAVRDYVKTRCFGQTINPDDDAVRSHLSRLELQEGIAKYLARKIAELTIERRAIEFDKADFRLSGTTPFHWRRNLPPLEAAKTVFNYVATYNDFERRFAVFLDKTAQDVLRFAALGTTEQGDSGTLFRVDYLKPSGARGFYHPDWVVVQETATGEVNWIIETKGRVWEGTEAKDEAILHWCDRVSSATGITWRYARVNQIRFDGLEFETLAQLVEDEVLPQLAI